MKEQDIAEIQEISSLVLKSLTDSNQLVFQRPTNVENRQAFEIPLLGSTAAILLQGAIPLLNLQKDFPNGLYTVSVNPAKLMQLKNGNLQGILLDKTGQIIKQVGFKKVSPAQIAVSTGPQLLLQAAVVATIVIYFQNILEQLDTISTKIDQLISYHHDEKLAILTTSHHHLKSIAERQATDQMDLHEIRQIGFEVDQVYAEYHSRLLTEHKKAVSFNPKAVLVGDKINNYVHILENFYFHFQVCYEANKLSLQSKVLEIILRMKKDITDPLLPELMTSLKQTFKTSLVHTAHQKLEKLYQPIQKNDLEILEQSKVLGVAYYDEEFELFKLDRQRKKIEANLTEELERTLVQVLEGQERQDLLVSIDQEGQLQHLYRLQ